MQDYICVIGGINIDIKGLPQQTLIPNTSNPGSVYWSAGGVGRNIAHNLSLLRVPVYLFGAVGDDPPGAQVLNDTQKVGVCVEHVRRVTDAPTGTYLSLLDHDGDLALAVSDMSICACVDIGYLQQHEEALRNSRFIVAETNLEQEVVAYLLTYCRTNRIPCLIEPVSVEKARKLLDFPGEIEAITPNVAELEVLAGYRIEGHEQLEDACARISRRYRTIFTTLGKEGVYCYQRGQGGQLHAPVPTQVVDANGAGDAFVAGLVCGLFQRRQLDDCIRLGMAAARITLQSKDTVSQDISLDACTS